ncbi:MAG: LysM peptidoglycan-binding domain-containing protein [Cytophagaceae bacterium]
MKRFAVLALLIFGVSFGGFAIGCFEDSIGVTKVEGKLHIKYLVMPGETIYGISTKYGIQISDLMDINPELMNGLKVGQEILIPYNPNLKKKDEENTLVHIVQPGETLYALSRKYNVPVGDLMKMNNMELKVGQKVVVGYKDQASSSPVAASEPKKEDPKKEEPVKQDKAKVEQAAPKEQQVLVKKGPEAAKAPEVEEPASPSPNFSSEQYPFNPDLKQVLIIPFDPYLYFSDADAEIAARSRIPSTKVRQVFRRRLNALMRAPGYETIHLLGGKAKDSLSDINKIYSSVTYNYQDIIHNPNYKEPEPEKGQVKNNNSKSWIDRQKDKLSSAPSANSGKAVHAKDNGRYFGVLIKNQELFTYFNYKYDVDYYIFINQFEVKTNYEHCLDRATQNYERQFVTHYSIFDKDGNQIAGNKFTTYYHSNSNDVYQIVSDNMEKIANRILAELPAP